MKQKLLSFLFLCVMFCATQALAQDRRVSGKVTSSETAEALIGASVSGVGSSVITQTDQNGNYTISIPTNVTTLQFRNLGYVTKTISITGTTLNVTLDPDQTNIDEVVVVGYGTGTPLSSVVGSVVKISGDRIAQRPSPNALDALQGQVAGLQIYTNSGEPSATPSIRLHGVGSLGASSTPLFVLDGAPVDHSSILSFNPNDYESVTVLKDASATAIYGSRAANGVIYFTSKKGARGAAPTISVETQWGLSQLAQTGYYEDVFNSQQLQDFWIQTGFRTQEQVDAIREQWDGDTQWFKVYNQDNQPMQQQNLSIRGGSDRTNYFISLGYYSQDGLAYRSQYDRYNLRSNIETDVNSWMKAGINLAVAYDERQVNPYASNILNYGLSTLTLPWYSAVDEDGNEYYDTPMPGVGRFHPRYLADMIKSDEHKVLFNPNAYIQLNPVKGLTIRSQAALEAFDENVSSRTMASYNNQFNGSAGENFRRMITQTYTSTIEYKYNLNNRHDFTGLVGHEYIDYTNNFFSASSQGHTDDRMMLLSAGPNNRNVSQSVTEYAFNSYFGRLGYVLDNKYHIDFTVREDASSRFGRDNSAAVFWSVGGMWRAKQEAFLQNVDWITDLTVRASYGTSGNSQIGNYQSLATVSTNIYGGATGWDINTAGNPQLAWEHQAKFTAGFTTRLFDRLSLDVGFYNRVTDNMLVSVPVPLTTGFANITSNVGSLLNRGFDFDIAFDVFRSPDYYLTPRFNINYNHNEVLELFQGNQYWIVPNTGVAWAVGQPVAFFYPVWAGVNPETGDAQWYLPNEDPDQIVNLNRDPNRVSTVFNTGSLQQSTGLDRYPPIAGGFGLSAGWKGIDLTVDFSFVSGKYMINNDRYFFENPTVFAGFNQGTAVADYWQNPGDVTTFPRYGVQFTQFDSRLLEDASFTRLKNLNLGYSFPRSLLARTGFVKGARVFFIGRNLLTFTDYTGQDPEFDTNVSLGRVPNSKQYTFGATFTF